MWIFSRYGFFSAVCAREGDGRHGRPVDRDRVMVRARVRDHLDRLQRRFPDELAACDVAESTGTDYRFRMFVGKDAWSRVVSGLASELDYDNFKGEVARHQGSAGSAYESALHDVWAVMNRLQPRA